MKNSFEVLLLWLNRTFKKNQDELLVKMDTKLESIQNLFKTSAEATVSPSDILEGQTAYNGTALITGSMKDRRGTTVTATAVAQDDEYTYLSLPETGCYDENSKVRAINSDLHINNMKQVKSGHV
ncbi:MAG: hypothetical protein NC548_38715, partial [Lachnospiraceae bacterium]|nr:hypothetical protein [Lachnospiraceae bacterium]